MRWIVCSHTVSVGLNQDSVASQWLNGTNFQEDRCILGLGEETC